MWLQHSGYIPVFMSSTTSGHWSAWKRVIQSSPAPELSRQTTCTSAEQFKAQTWGTCLSGAYLEFSRPFRLPGPSGTSPRPVGVSKSCIHPDVCLYPNRCLNSHLPCHSLGAEHAITSTWRDASQNSPFSFFFFFLSFLDCPSSSLREEVGMPIPKGVWGCSNKAKSGCLRV